MHQRTLTTARLRLRPMGDGDADLLLALDSDPEVRRFVDQPDPPTAASAAAMLTRMLDGAVAHPGLGFWVGEVDGEPVGWWHLKPPRPGEPAEPGDLEVGYRLFRSAWGRGYATEGGRAMAEVAVSLGAPRLTGVADPRNVGSVAVLEKLGLRRTLTFDHAARAGGVLTLGLWARSLGSPVSPG